MKEIRIKLPPEYNCETNNNIITEIKNGELILKDTEVKFGDYVKFKDTGLIGIVTKTYNNVCATILSIDNQYYTEEISHIVLANENVKKVLQNPNNYTFCIFNDGDTYSKEGLGHKYLIEAIEKNKQIIQNNVIKNINECNYSEEITYAIEKVVDKITSNMDYLVGLLKQNKENGKH